MGMMRRTVSQAFVPTVWLGCSVMLCTQNFGERWTDEQINDMVYHRKSDGSFTIHDLRAVLTAVETELSRPNTGFKPR